MNKKKDLISKKNKKNNISKINKSLLLKRIFFIILICLFLSPIVFFFKDIYEYLFKK